MIDETEALRVVIEAASQAPIIFTTGYTCRRALAIEDSPNHFYMVGSMGLASSIAMGLAQSRPDLPVVVVEGDGSFLMNPSNIAMIRAGGISNVHHVVLDNGHYASTGNQPTISSHLDFVGAARAFGYDDSVEAPGAAALGDRLKAAVHDAGAGSTFTYCRVGASEGSPGGRLELPLPDLRRRFEKWLGDAAPSSGR